VAQACTDFPELSKLPDDDLLLVFAIATSAHCTDVQTKHSGKSGA